jgi:hypothetical protein
MAQYDKIDGTERPTADAEKRSEQPNKLTEEYLLQTAGKAQEKAKPAEPKLEIPKAEKLGSGDLLQRHNGNEFLTMPDGTKMAIQNDLPVENNLPVPLNERLTIQGKDGKYVAVKYVGTKTSMPAIDEYTFSNGMKAQVVDGVADISSPNGDRILLDDLGLLGIKRQQGEALVRKPAK